VIRIVPGSFTSTHPPPLKIGSTRQTRS
jgi:hypothetical protein